MKPIETPTGEDRAVSALLGNAATLAGGITMKLLGRTSRNKPRRASKPKRTTLGTKKGGLRHG